ncbi:cAMP-specific 3',5'-cyclic phosphodiesterase 4D [Nowakowskiella sp. JEL0407]|nr:cAMP-specific 3',5'-cyclic phosphodiesterase 4D [Nowakowskiella sp. JEL0407]
MSTTLLDNYQPKFQKRQVQNNSSSFTIGWIVPEMDDYYRAATDLLNITLAENYDPLEFSGGFKILPIVGNYAGGKAVSYLRNISSMNALVGVIGAGTMDYLQLSALWTSALNIPMCSGSFYDDDFNSTEFPTFFRTSPTPNMYARAIIQLIKYNKWNRIAVLNSDYETVRSGTFLHELNDELSKSESNLTIYFETYGSNGGETLESCLADIVIQQRSIILFLGNPVEYIDTLKKATTFGLVGADVVWIVPPDVHYYLESKGAVSPADYSLLSGTLSVAADVGKGPRYEKFLESWNNFGNFYPSFKLFPKPPETIIYHRVCLELLIQEIKQIFRGVSLKGILESKISDILSEINVPKSFEGMDTSIGKVEFINSAVDGYVYLSYYGNGEFVEFAKYKNGSFIPFAPIIYHGGSTTTPLDVKKSTAEILRFWGLTVGLPISAIILTILIISYFIYRYKKSNTKRPPNHNSMQSLGQPKVDVQSNVKTATDILNKNRSKRTGKVGLTPYEVQFILSVLTATTEDQFTPNFQAMEEQDGGVNAIDEETKAWVLSAVMASAPQKRANGSILHPSNFRASITRRAHGMGAVREHGPVIQSTSSNWFRASNIVDNDKVSQSHESNINNYSLSSDENHSQYSGQKHIDVSFVTPSDSKLKSGIIPRQSLGVELGGGGGSGASEGLQPLKDLERIDQNKVEDYMNLWYVSWNFDMFHFSEMSDGHPLYFTAVNLLHSKEVLNVLNINAEKFQRWMLLMESEYHDHPYHNAIHAADVLHAFNYLLLEDPMSETYTPVEIFAGMIAAIGHDIDHPGLNNQFLVKSRDELAVLYSDVSVNEYHHIAHIFQTSSKSKYNIFADFSNEEYEEIRKIIIRLILATDMSNHFEYLTKFKTKLQQSNIAIGRLETQENRMIVMEIAMKCADLNNPSKTSDLARKWTENIMEEFFRQGDREREMGLPISQFMDRTNTNIAKCQIGFIDILVAPLYDAWITFNNHNEKCLKLQREIGKNRNHWAGLSTSQQILAQQSALKSSHTPTSSELNRRNSETAKDPNAHTPSVSVGPGGIGSNGGGGTGGQGGEKGTPASSISMQRTPGPGSQHSMNIRKSMHPVQQSQALTVSSGSWSSKKRSSMASVKPTPPMILHASKSHADELLEDEIVKV